jgi:hypothetical protein
LALGVAIALVDRLATQPELARRIGAANKSVIYQWETRRRTPSVVFWVRVEQLAQASSSPANRCGN